MRSSKKQAKFYDSYPPIVPWPDLLLESGFSCLYKPREIFWKKELDRIGMREKDSILEVGCGQGLFLARLVKAYKVKGTGIDVSQKSIEFAKNKYKNKNLSFKIGDGTNVPFTSGSFDFVMSFDVLEHITDQKKAIEEMMRVLKPGGKLLVHTLNKDYKYTLDWVWQKLGIDIFSRAAHDPTLFLDINWLRKAVQSRNGKILRLKLFDAFFTLAIDELIMAFVSLYKNLKFENKILGNIFLFSSDLISRALFPLTSFLDNKWYEKGHSLSFIIIAQKKNG